MCIRSRHLIYSDEQIANMIVQVVNDNDIEASYLEMNVHTGQLVVVLRRSTAQQDEKYLRENLEIARVDWLGMLGYYSHEDGVQGVY